MHFLLAFIVVAGASPASFLTYDTVMSQMQSIPFNATTAQHTLTNLAKAYKLYPFLEIAANPPDPEHFSPPVDLMGSFATLAKTTFANDFMFQEALKAVFVQLHDAHTAYWPPLEYRYKVCCLGGRGPTFLCFSSFITS